MIVTMGSQNGPCNARCQIRALCLQVSKKLAQHFYVLSGNLKALNLIIMFVFFFVCLGKRTSFRIHTIGVRKVESECAFFSC